MLINSGKYKFVRAAIGSIALSNKDSLIPIFSYDSTKKIGQAKVVEENPLTLDIEFFEDIEIPGNFFTIVLQNHTIQNGNIINVFSFKLNYNLLDYTPNILSEENFKKRKTTKRA